MKKACVGVALAATVFLGTAGAASAGEIRGNGEPRTNLNGQSICQFSGLNDQFEDPTAPAEDYPWDRTQNWGHVLRNEGVIPTGSAKIGSAAGLGLIQEFGPGASCRGNLSFEE